MKTKFTQISRPLSFTVSLLFFFFSFLIPTTALAGTIQYTYDSAGRLTGVTYADGSSITYTYDKAGNLLNIVNTTSTPHPTLTLSPPAPPPSIPAIP